MFRASAGGAIVEQSEFIYDEDNCLLIRTLSGDAAGDEEVDSFFQDPEDICRYVDCEHGGEPTQNYIYGPGIEQLFDFDNADGDIQWFLTDKLGCVEQVGTGPNEEGKECERGVINAARTIGGWPMELSLMTLPLRRLYVARELRERRSPGVEQLFDFEDGAATQSLGERGPWRPHLKPEKIRLQPAPRQKGVLDAIFGNVKDGSVGAHASFFRGAARRVI